MMAREICVDTDLLQDLYGPTPKIGVGTKNLRGNKPKKWALESPPKTIKRKMKRGLRSLQTADNEMEAKRAIASLWFQASFDEDSKEADEAEQRFCRRLFRQNTIPILLEAIVKWKKSLHFISKAVILLIKITYFEPQSLPTIAEHNGIQLLLSIGNSYQHDLNLSADILMVLENLSNAGLDLDKKGYGYSLDWMKVLATSECIGFVATKMQDYPSDDILQRNACGYVQNIGYCISSHDKLYQRGVPYLLETTIENFRYSNSKLVSQAEEALYVIDNLYQ